MSPSRADRLTLVRCGLLDLEWIGEQVGHHVDGPWAAADELLADRTLSPHPLFEPAWFDPDGSASAHHAHPLLWFLDDPQARRRTPHPLVGVEQLYTAVEGILDERGNRVRVEEGGVLATWVFHAGASTPLPSPPAAPRLTWGRFREAAFRALHEPAEVVDGRRAGGAGRAATDVPSSPGEAPLVSVLLRATDRAPVLRELLDQVRAEVPASWELVAVDEGSTDDTASVLAGIAHHEPRVRVVSLDPAVQEPGTVAALAAAASAATGASLAVLDPDSPWRPGHLRAAVEHLTGSRSGAVVTTVGRGAPTRPSLDAGDLLHLPPAETGLVVVRRPAYHAVGGPAATDVSGGGAWFDLLLRVAARYGADVLDRPGRPEDPPPGPSLAMERSRAAAPVLLDWDAAADRARDPDLVSVVVATRDDDVRTAVSWCLGIRGRPRAARVELVVVAGALEPGRRRVLRTLASLLADVRLLEAPGELTTSLELDLGLVASTGDRVALVRPRTRLKRGSVVRAADVLDDPQVDLVQPLLVTHPGGAVLSAGASFGTCTRPEGLLGGHPVADATPLDRRQVPAPFGPVVVARAALLLDARGLDPALPDGVAETDLGLRTGGRVVLATDATARVRASDLTDDPGYDAGARELERRHPVPPPGSDELWRAAGFEVVARRNRASAPPGDGPGLLVPRAVVTAPALRLRLAERPPRLRWTIDTSAVGNAADRNAGSSEARAIARELERLDQRVAVDTRDLRARGTRDLDDVLLVLRGQDSVQPRPGLANLLWVVGHQEQVSPSEAAGFDLVYAADASWARSRSEAWGLEVQPLLPAFDQRWFDPAHTSDGTHDLLVLSNATDPEAAHVRAVLPSDVTVTTMLGRGDKALRQALDSAAVVLYEHPATRRHAGPLSSRLFRAAATGARILTDRPEARAVLGGLVHSLDEVDLLDAVRSPDRFFPALDERRRIATELARDHSYEVRARRLLDDVLALVRRRTGVEPGS
ncbi:glycosyltransferase [Nocardioides litoris]|uniref:glycosyltransferase n=1 Tax=Nocardioides litoris TaxID=1926648 RepID=UPI0014775529|nr:glycosyltransferase [Nocardioides litoris]